MTKGRARSEAKRAPLSSGEVAERAGISDQRLQTVLRGMPAAQRPPVVAGRRLWGPEHVAALEQRLAELEEREGQRG